MMPAPAMSAVRGATASAGHLISPAATISPQSLSPVAITAASVSLTWESPAGTVNSYSAYDDARLSA